MQTRARRDCERALFQEKMPKSGVRNSLLGRAVVSFLTEKKKGCLNAKGFAAPAWCLAHRSASISSGTGFSAPSRPPRAAFSSGTAQPTGICSTLEQAARVWLRSRVWVCRCGRFWLPQSCAGAGARVCFVWVDAPSIVLAPALGMQSQHCSSPRPSPVPWQSLSPQKYLEATQILSFSQALEQS